MSPQAASITAPRGVHLPPRGSAFWLAVAPLAALALAALAMWLAGIPGGDDPAHLYKIGLLRSGQSLVWDNFWYGGSYGALAYGVVYYWLAQFVPGTVLVVVAGGLLPLFFHAYLRDEWGVRERTPAWVLAGVLVVYLAWGQSPFLVALSLTIAGLALLARGHPWPAAALCAVGVFTNPLALVAGGVFVLAGLVAHGRRRRVLVFALALLPVVVLRTALAEVFRAPSYELHYTAELLGLVTFAAIGIVMARACREERRAQLQWVFVAFVAVVVPAFLVPHMPVGNNAGRFFYVFGAPLLVATMRRNRLPSWGLTVMFVAVLAFQVAFPLVLLARVGDFPATREAFFAPALAEAQKLYDPDYRYHVVTPERHWEAYYFPAAGFAITRGWFRQDDALHNDELYRATLSVASYTDWLRRLGVRYVFLPHAPLVGNARQEAQILRRSRAFRVVDDDGLWTVYRLVHPAPLVVPLSGASAAHVLTLDHVRLRFSVTRPGPYLVKLTWSPYWLVARRPTRASLRGRDISHDREWEDDATPADGTYVRRDPYGFMVFTAPRAGLYTLRFDAAGTAAAELRQ